MTAGKLAGDIEIYLDNTYWVGKISYT